MLMKSQSAVEYLMTYGWAILIIAVALGALYFLGFLNPSGFVNQQCLLPSGLSCTILQMTTSGVLKINLFQTTSSQINITAIGCNSNNTFANSVPYSTGNQITLPPGTNTTLTVQCYSGPSSFSSSVGSTFLGYVLINYTEPFVAGFPHTASGKIISKTSSGPTTSTTSTTSTSTTSVSSTSTSTTSTTSTSTSTTSTTSTSTTTIPNYLLTVTSTDTNQGTVSCTAGGISTSCSASYPAGTQIVITAAPGTAYLFSTWSGAAGTSNPATVTMSGAVTDAASFAYTCFAGGTAAGGTSGGVNCAISTVGANTVDKFTYSSSPGSTMWTLPAGVTQVTDLVVAGGGGGGGDGYGGAGAGEGGAGAGGLIYNSLYSVSAGTYTVTIGSGGSGGANTGGYNLGSNGYNSVFGSLVATGGGGGGAGTTAGKAGGSGGGSSYSGSGGSGVAGQGHAGGSASTTNPYAGAGGGGSGGAGGNPLSNSAGGLGGIGTSNSITGSAVTYAVGGAGANGWNVGNGVAGTANTGNGGTGAGGGTGGTGGSGIVIISYPTP